MTKTRTAAQRRREARARRRQITLAGADPVIRPATRDNLAPPPRPVETNRSPAYNAPWKPSYKGEEPPF